MDRNRIAGIFLVGSAGLGILLRLFSVIGIWVKRPGIAKTVKENLTLIDHALVPTEQVLIRVNKVVQADVVDVTSVQATTKVVYLGILPKSQEKIYDPKR